MNIDKAKWGTYLMAGSAILAGLAHAAAGDSTGILTVIQTVGSLLAPIFAAHTGASTVSN